MSGVTSLHTWCVCPNTSLGLCPSSYHLCFLKSTSEILRVPFANDEGDVSWHGILPDKTKSAHHCSSCWFLSLRSTAPCLCCTRHHISSLVRALKSSVAFRPTLGQRSSSELCRRICGGSGVERGSLHPASWPKPVYHEAVTGVTVPQPQHLQGVSKYLGRWRRWCKTTSGQSWIPRRCAASLLLK